MAEKRLNKQSDNLNDKSILSTSKKTTQSKTLQKRQVGRPRLFKNPEEVESKAHAYFKGCDEDKRPYTIAGLAYELGFSARTQFSDYANDYPEFSDTIKRLRLKVETQKVEWLNSKDKFTPGLIFDLKNNHGYKETQDFNLGGQEANPLTFTIKFLKSQYSLDEDDGR